MHDFPFTASGQSPDEILGEVIEDLADMMEGDWWFEDEDCPEVPS